MHPHIFVTAEKIEGLRSVEDVRRGIRSGHSKALWEQLVRLADTEADLAPYTPTSDLPGRGEVNIRRKNPDWGLVNAVCQRIQRAALAYLITEKQVYRGDVLRQMASLFDTKVWPDWRDQAHPRTEVDLRAGALSPSIALAYDWMYPLLSESERAWILEGLDARALQLYLRDIEAGAYWANVRTNWLTVVVGGHGIAGMALGDDHPAASQLIDFAMPRMLDYLKQYGPDGEFSESVGYSSSTVQPVAFFAANRYHTGGGVNRLAEHPFPQTCHWTLYFTLPPGRYAAFGDGEVDAPPALSYLTAVADATRDGVLQQFYLDYAEVDETRRALAWELLWFDPDLEPAPLDGRIPTGRAYAKHDAGFSSRADWNPATTPSIVYGKAGSGVIVHGNHDVGQVCIDGYGERLIVDLGSPPGYPSDYGSKKYEYYNAAAFGHNILTFGGREMKHEGTVEARIVDAQFTDGVGGIWQVDLTSKYDGVKALRRTVTHVHPRTIAVLDEAALESPETISLRWHTAVPSEPDGSGIFTVATERAVLSARVVSLLDDLTFGARRHEYKTPYNRHRLGDLFPQRHETFIEATTDSTKCCILSLFTIFPPDWPTVTWNESGQDWSIATPEGAVSVATDNQALRLHAPAADLTLDLLELQ